jgi:PAS domain S-box-containing protein
VPSHLGRFGRQLRRVGARLSPEFGVMLIVATGLAVSSRVALWARSMAALSWQAEHAALPPGPLHDAAQTLLPMWGTLAAGASVTACLAVAYWLVANAHQRADHLVQEISESLLSKRSSTRAMADSAADAIVVVNEQRRIYWVNQRASGVFGFAREALPGMAVPQILPAFMGQQMASWLVRNGDGTSAVNVDTLGLHADGTAFPITVSVSSFRTPGQLLYTCIIRATANAKWAARELMLRERALASSTNGITIADMKREGEPFIYVNPAFEDLTGYTAQEAVGRNARFLQQGDNDQEAVAALRKAIDESRSCHVVLRNYRKDGSMFWNDLSIAPVQEADGQVTHYVGIQIDITERMRAEAALQLRTDRLNAVFALSPDGFVALDAQDVVTIVNPAFERMTGLDAAQLIGQPIEQFEEALAALCFEPQIPNEEPRRFVETQPPDANDLDRLHDVPPARFGPSAASAMADTVPAQLSNSPLTPQHALQQGLLHLRLPSERTLLRRTRRARDHGKETVMYFRDITRELEVDRMKSEFLSTAAHELRTPMSSIFGFAELLLKRSYDAVHQREMLSTIHRQAGVLINLINELLDLARIEARRGKDFDFHLAPLQAAIRSTVDGLLMAGDERRVSVRLPCDPILVNIDAEKLSLALTNVLSNAYKYSPEGGDITLDIVWREREHLREVGISVQDSGIGMNPAQLDQIFDRFYRADASGSIPGTGLGMAIVKEISELHGGHVAVSSHLGVGTNVTIWLPCPRTLPRADLAQPSLETHVHLDSI